MEPAGSGATPTTGSGGTLFGFSGAQLRRVGVVLLVVGGVLFFGFVAIPLFAMQNFMQDPFSGSRAPPTGSFLVGFIVGGIGMVLFALGGAALRLGLVRPVTGYVASEAAPAIRVGGAALGQGLREGMGAPVPSTAAVVRVKCRNCGYLDTEDATYCSKCGQPL